jgi:Fic/DOC family
MSVRTISRRSSLESLMSTVSALSDATINTLARYAPHLPRHNVCSTTADLAHLNAITTDTVHRTANNPWRDYDSRHTSLEDHSACRSPVPGSAVLHGAQRWIAESDPRRWTGVHALVSAAMMHMEFIRLQPFQRANRRLGRTLFQAQLYESGWPVLPWHYAFERQHARYVSALEASFVSRSYEPIVRVVLKACAEAIAKGNEMVSCLEPERSRLIKVLEADEVMYEGDSRWYAEALLSGIFLEGFSSEQRGVRNAPEVLRKLYLAGELDRIHTPLGAVYSTPICRDLIK